MHAKYLKSSSHIIFFSFVDKIKKSVFQKALLYIFNKQIMNKRMLFKVWSKDPEFMESALFQ